MNRINPLYIIFFLVFIFIFISFELLGLRDELSGAKDDYHQALMLSKELSGLKKAYGHKLRLPTSVSSKVKQKKLKNGVSISSKNMDIETLDFIMSKVLNGSYRIKKLKILRIKDNKVNFYMEIKW
jgi:regulatory protein YycI of two-component signal transduction system YycFG